MWQLLSGAEKMHGRRVIHRDIKPSNILVGAAGRSVVKICDFGLAMSMDDRPPYEQAGTLCYMAPEMLLEKPDYDERVDAWSLGCVMAELINGWSPFQGLNEEGQLCAIFDVLGVPDDTTWPWFSSTTFAAVWMPELDSVPRRSLLREHFPETTLSEEGFEVLSGLLTCNPEKRLTAAAALKHPWFAKIDALELPMREEVASALPRRLKRLRVLCP
ncbi:putative cyclin-dependent kinase F-2 [Panicum miliaceum]|uniref:[RNA-polymerase]-subunit kinase n=1 Tax=Panicum miliaceum TaxID=4540 RepID=A0A3L6SE62_PANMI|nr:putative cyclin-dependent kinase F-2 [Panicum miliaceum]